MYREQIKIRVTKKCINFIYKIMFLFGDEQFFRVAKDSHSIYFIVISRTDESEVRCSSRIEDQLLKSINRCAKTRFLFSTWSVKTFNLMLCYFTFSFTKFTVQNNHYNWYHELSNFSRDYTVGGLKATKFCVKFYNLHSNDLIALARIVLVIAKNES